MVQEERRDNDITESIQRQQIALLQQRHKPNANWPNMARQNPCKVSKKLN